MQCNPLPQKKEKKEKKEKKKKEPKLNSENEKINLVQDMSFNLDGDEDPSHKYKLHVEGDEVTIFSNKFGKSKAMKVLEGNRDNRMDKILKNDKEGVKAQLEGREEFLTSKRKEKRKKKIDAFRGNEDEDENQNENENNNEQKEKKKRKKKEVKEINPSVSKPKNEKEVNEYLISLGVEKIDTVSRCLRASILKGHLKMDGLDFDVRKLKCENCRKPVKCRVRDLLYQPD